MPVEFTKRDVQMVIDQVVAAGKSADNLQKLSGPGAPKAIGRPLASAITKLDEARMWLNDLITAAPEGF